MGTRKPRAVAYVRVSTHEQVDGYGLDVQEREIKACLKGAGFRLVSTHRDEGVSGGLDAEDRPALADALQALTDDDADVLVVAKLDRLARELTVQEAALAHVWRLGKRVWSCDVGEVAEDDPDDPMRTAMRQMVGVFAQLERGMIRARMRSGRRRKAEEGGYVGGAPAYGYRAEDGDLRPYDGERQTVDRIVQLRDEGLSYRQIVNVLHEEGRRPKRGARWYPQTVARVYERAQSRSR